jgi:acyl carrier protein
MSPKLTEQGVREVISSVVVRIGSDDLGVSEDFHDFGFDSLDHAQILMRIEEVFGVLIAADDFDACRSIGAILDYAARPIEPAC